MPRPLWRPALEVPPPNAALNLAHPLARELGAAWLFNDGAASIARDLGPFHLDATLKSYGAGNLAKTPLGAQNTLTASTDAFEAPDHEILSRDSQSLAALVRISAANATNGSADLIEKWSGGSYPLSLRFLSAAQPTALCYDQSNNPAATGPTSLADGKLHVIVGVRVAHSTISLYVDGVLAASVTDTASLVTANTAVLTIGNRYHGDGRPRAPQGAIRGVWQWGRALDASEVQAFSAAPFAMFAAPRALWRGVDVSTGGAPAAVSASGTVILPHLTASGTGAALARASGAATMPHLTASGTGAVTAKASGTVTMPSLTASGTASVGNAAHASGAVVLPHLTASGTATSPHAAVGSVTLPHLTASGAGQALARAGGTVSLPHFVASGQAAALARASGVAILPMLRAAATGHVVPIGAHDAALAGSLALRPRLVGGTSTRPRLIGTITIRPAS